MLKDLDNWDRIPLETYKGIYEEAKVRFNEIVEQSEAMTTYSIRMLVANSAVLAWFVNIFSSGFQIGIWFYILIFIVLIAYLLIFKVLAPRISVLRGTDPKSILKAEDDLAGFIEDEENTESQKIKVF